MSAPTAREREIAEPLSLDGIAPSVRAEAIAQALADARWQGYVEGKEMGRRLLAIAIRDELAEEGL